MQHQILFIMIKLLFCCINIINSKSLAGINVNVARSYEYKYVVCIVGMNPELTLEENTLCTGTLISGTHVLTVEHCLYNAYYSPFLVIAGANHLYDSKGYHPLWYISYDQWAVSHNLEINMENDVAVTRTIERMPAELGIAYIPILSLFEHIIGSTFVMVGWGKSNTGEFSTHLEYVNTTVVTRNQCLSNIARLQGYLLQLPLSYICSKAVPFALLRDGDSGGPLLLENIVIAINKATCPKLDGNIHPEKMNIHIRLDIYINFITFMLAQV